MTHLVILPILFPLVGAFTLLLLPRALRGWMASGIMAASLAASGWLLWTVVDTNTAQIFHSGGWFIAGVPVGITLVADLLSALFVVMSQLYDSILQSQALMLASPIFFYSVSAHTKILMDRCQSLWVKKHWLEETSSGRGPPGRKGLFISAGATRGKKLFDGTLLTVRYYFEAVDCELWKSLLYRELDFEGDVLEHPEYLEEAHRAGADLVRALENG